MKRYRIPRKGRVSVVYGVVSDLDIIGAGVTMTQVARAMGLQPSTYVMNILWELFHEGDVRYRITELRNGGIVRLWRITRPEEKADVKNLPF